MIHLYLIPRFLQAITFKPGQQRTVVVPVWLVLLIAFWHFEFDLKCVFFSMTIKLLDLSVVLVAWRLMPVETHYYSSGKGRMLAIMHWFAPPVYPTVISFHVSFSSNKLLSVNNEVCSPSLKKLKHFDRFSLKAQGVWKISPTASTAAAHNIAPCLAYSLLMVAPSVFPPLPPRESTCLSPSGSLHCVAKALWCDFTRRPIFASLSMPHGVGYCEPCQWLPLHT